MAERKPIVNVSGALKELPSGDTIQANATSYSVAQTSHGFAAGDVIRSSGTANSYTKAKADTAANAEIVGVVTIVQDADNFTFTSIGVITSGVPSGTAGEVFFLDTNTAGAITTTDPMVTGTVGTVSKPILILLESSSKALVIQMRGATVTSPINGWTYIVLPSDVTNNNSTANSIADVTGLSFSVVSGTTYEFEFFIIYTAAALATGSRWSINGPSTTFLHYQSDYTLTSTSQTTIRGNTSYDLPSSCNVSSATTASNTSTIKGVIKPSANGTVIARFASEVSNSAIVAKGGISFVKYRIIP
ncbi:MAG: hypothetical protein HYZ54_00075 [Ignavibacteriae bacterium]|nr:hypothetical protein [Ignavibacteriota bacterium]